MKERKLLQLCGFVIVYKSRVAQSNGWRKVMRKKTDKLTICLKK